MKNFFTIQLSLLAYAVPYFARAQGQDFKSIVGTITGFFLDLLPVLATLALLVFFWGLAEYVFQSGDQEAADAGRERIAAGIIGLFSIAALWGLVQILGNTFSIL